jgi:hypothetical protein
MRRSRLLEVCGIAGIWEQERLWRRLAVELWFRDFILADGLGA